MLLFRPVAAPLRCRAFPTPVKSPCYGCSKAASDSTSRGSTTGCSIKMQDSRNRDGVPCVVIRIVPSSKWDGANNLSSRSVTWGDSRSEHAARKKISSLPSVHSGGSVAAASCLATATKTTATFKAAAPSATPDSIWTFQHFSCRGRTAFQPWTAGIARAGAVPATSVHSGRNKVAERVGLTEVGVLTLPTTTLSAATGEAAIGRGTTRITSARGKVAAAARRTPMALGANKVAATEEEQRSDRPQDVDAAVPAASQRKQPRWTDGKPVVAAAQAATFGGALQAPQDGTVTLIRWRVAAQTVQARSVAHRCRVQQRQTHKYPGTLGGPPAVKRTEKVAEIGGTDIIKGKHRVGTFPLLFDLACPAEGVAAALCASGFVRARCTHTAPGQRDGGRSLPLALFIKHFTTLSEDRVKNVNPPEDRTSSWRPGTCAASASSTQKSDNLGAPATLSKQGERKQHEKSCDATQEQSAFRPSRRSQRLLGFLATMGACISLMLLYERFLIDSAALLCGAWDSEWDASWRAGAQQYEAELAARGLQLLPSGREATRGVLTTSLRPPTRQVILVRHGQYRSAATDEERDLTDLGRRQAAATGRRLQQLLQGQHVQAIFHSNMKRARQTAEIIKESGGFKAVPLVEDALLAEGAPAVPVPATDSFKPNPTDIAVDGQRIEQAFRRYFYRPRCRRPLVASSSSAGPASLSSTSPANGDAAAASAKAAAAPTADPSADARSSQCDTLNDSFIILVCHGNVIRYFLMRALQLPASAWLRWALFNTGLTWIGIDAEGRVSCRGFGDVGHLSTHMISYN